MIWCIVYNKWPVVDVGKKLVFKLNFESLNTHRIMIVTFSTIFRLKHQERPRSEASMNPSMNSNKSAALPWLLLAELILCPAPLQTQVLMHHISSRHTSCLGFSLSLPFQLPQEFVSRYDDVTSRHRYFPPNCYFSEPEPQILMIL